MDNFENGTGYKMYVGSTLRLTNGYYRLNKAIRTAAAYMDFYVQHRFS